MDEIELVALQLNIVDLDKRELIKALKEFFKIEELVDPDTFRIHGESSWMFLDEKLLANVLFFRMGIDKPFIANTWSDGGRFDERGLRPNISEIVSNKTRAGRLYLSAHTMGKALDWHIKGMTSEDARKWAFDNSGFFPYKFRLENTLKGKQISWIHLDVYNSPSNPYCTLLNI